MSNYNIDFFVLSETWLTPSSPEAITLPSYKVFRKESTRKGLGSSVKSHLKRKELELPNEIKLECHRVNICKHVLHSYLTIYQKTTAKADFYDELKMLLNICDNKREYLFNWVF